MDFDNFEYLKYFSTFLQKIMVAKEKKKKDFFFYS